MSCKGNWDPSATTNNTPKLVTWPYTETTPLDKGNQGIPDTHNITHILPASRVHRKDSLAGGITHILMVRPFIATTLVDGTRRHPFVEGLMEVHLPLSWKGLTMDKYNGTMDLEKHLDVYVNQVSLYTSDDYVLCWIFPTLLKGPTLSWFTKLPPSSIDSFNTLVARLNT